MVEEVETKVELKPYGISYSGKHDGWAYQFLDDNYKGIHLGVCCKDFLNDIVWSELTKKSMRVHSQPSSYIGVLDKQEHLKLCMYPRLFNGIQEPIIENIEELRSNLEAFLNEIELLRGFNLSTVEVHDNRFVIIFHKDWINKIYLFSLFTLLCRVGLYYNGNLEEYLQNPYLPNNKYLDNCDFYYFKNNYKKVIEVIENKLTIEQQNWEDINTCGNRPYDVHDGNSFFNSLDPNRDND